MEDGKSRSRSFGIFIGVAALIATVIAFGDGHKLSNADDPSKSSSATDAPCNKDDLQCWGDRLVVAAGFKYPKAIESLARFEVKWTDSLLEPKFSRFHWADTSHKVVTLRGDKASMSNGFGAYQNIIYECDMGVADDKVLDVRAYEGRLP